MRDYDPTTYGRRLADDYDAMVEDELDTEAAVEGLAMLAGEGPVLELGIGTGRLALPLAERGLDVCGVDASEDMVARLRTKPGGADLPVVVGDFAEAEVDGRFTLVVLAVNTIYALPSQEAQVRCFANAARHLLTGGRFVVDAWIPDVAAFRRDRGVRVRVRRDDAVTLEVIEHDAAGQWMHVTSMRISDDRVQVDPLHHRYAWPSELDLMARLAGLELEHRWEDWHRRPFVSASPSHVSVWRLPEPVSGDGG